MAEDEQDPKQRLVVDEDWKAQVEKEKAAARAQQAQQSAETAAGEGGSAADRDDAAKGPSGPTEQASSKEPGAEPSGPADADAGGLKAGPADETASQGGVPPASFSVLVSMLFTQAMAALGQIPDPDTGKPTVDRMFAKHYIDTLGMLEEKTQGNLSPEEAAMLSEALHALRMTFVSTK